jgi:hypothetical protein
MTDSRSRSIWSASSRKQVLVVRAVVRDCRFARGVRGVTGATGPARSHQSFWIGTGEQTRMMSPTNGGSEVAAGCPTMPAAPLEGWRLPAFPRRYLTYPQE